MSLVFFAVTVFLLVMAVGYLPFIRQFASQPVLLHRMTGIAAGFLLGAALLIALPEGFDIYLHTDHSAHNPFSAALTTSSAHKVFSPTLTAGLAVLAGFLFMLMLEGFGFGHDLHEEHHDHAADHGHDHLNHPAGSARNVVIGLSLHSIMDGLAIGAAFALGEVVLSIQLALVILMHKFPAAFSLSAYSLHERGNRRRSLWDLVLFALTTPIALIVSSQFFAGLDQAYIGLMLLFSAGCFIYVATVDVLPDIHIREKSRETLWLVLAGIIMMVLLSLFITVFIPGSLHAH